jgi:peptide/nickel transport system permease protein
MGGGGRIGLAWLALVGAAALLSLAWTPWDVSVLDVAHRLAPASLSHPLGTDQLGRDLLSMGMAGAVPSLATALAAVLLGMGVGVPLGLLAALAPSWADELVSRIGDVLFAFPALVLALLLVAVLGAGESRLALAIGLFFIPVFLRITRAGAAGLVGRDFVPAARLAGRTPAAIARVHLLPNLRGLLLAQAAIQFALALLAEAGLAFLGLGAQPPTPSWGRMVADGQTLIGIAPRLVLLPGVALVLTVLAVTLVADDLQRRVRR